MSYEIEYLGTREENETKALQDCKDFFGDKYEEVLGLLREVAHDNKMTRGTRYFAIAMNLAVFCGVRGYWPVRAMVREASK